MRKQVATEASVRAPESSNLAQSETALTDTVAVALPNRFAWPHQVERAVRRELLAQPGLRFSSLVVRRIRDGICLEGVLESEDGCPDVCGVVRNVADVDQVLNHLVVRRTPKG